jgi:hypothetical protein
MTPLPAEPLTPGLRLPLQLLLLLLSLLLLALPLLRVAFLQPAASLLWETPPALNSVVSHSIMSLVPAAGNNTSHHSR